MAHHKRKRPKHQRAGCLACKPWKDERAPRAGYAPPATHGNILRMQATTVTFAPDAPDATRSSDVSWWDGQHIVAQGDGVTPKAVVCDCGLKDCTGLRRTPIEAREWLTVTPAYTEPIGWFGCSHGRLAGQACPHCLGLS